MRAHTLNSGIYLYNLFMQLIKLKAQGVSSFREYICLYKWFGGFFTCG